MKYLDLLTKLKEAGQTAERCKRELTNIAESGKSELHQTANLKAAYMRASPQVPAETVIEKNPDVYIVTSAQEYFEKPAGFDEIAAFKNGEVHYIDYFDPVCDMVSRPGPRFVEGLRKSIL